MNDKDFLIKYGDLLNKGYCACNEMNCIDNNSPRRILNIAIKQQKEIDRLNNIIEELKKDINNEMMMTRKFDKYNEGYFDATLHYYNKLKELKEEND